jgi:hypothetical protein
MAKSSNKRENYLEVWIADGSSNIYNFKQADQNDEQSLFVYEPVEPKMSFSGTYSGGKPINKLVVSSDVNVLYQLLTKVSKIKSEQTANRTLGSTSVRISKQGVQISYILKYQSDSSHEVAVMLENLKNC